MNANNLNFLNVGEMAMGNENVNGNHQNQENRENMVQQPNRKQEPTFTATASTMVLWNYAIAIAQDDREHREVNPHAPPTLHPPVPMSRRERCLLTLMVEERRDMLMQLWQEMKDVERVLGLE
ncbi:hypothetical protein P692DRAFT_201871733 [Suillus brevipes Sb2]|nr:hypothetical protein P692DRAFT_201871733 [Suillus brevipes Sb2]